MEAISFPISREAACCGIYIYLGSTRVGMKTKEQLRTDYLRMYEDSYKSGLEKRRQKKLNQRAREAEIPSPVDTSNVATAGSFLSMISSLPKAPEKPAIAIENDLLFELGEKWVAPLVKSRVVSQEEPTNWVSNGVELFSITVEKPASRVEDEEVWSEPEDVFEDASEDIWEPGDAVTESDDVFEDAPEGSADSVDWEDGDDLWEPEEDAWEPEEVIPTSQPKVEKSVVRAEKPPVSVERPISPKQKTFSDVKAAPKPVVQAPVSATRLDENAIRDYVKAHKLCSESDIFSAFPGHDKVKVRTVIKSALRKYKIFEKHGKFTV